MLVSKSNIISSSILLVYLTLIYANYSYAEFNEVSNYREMYDVPNPLQNRVSPGNIHVLYDVPLIPQETGYSCWAAGAAMIVSWRDDVPVSPYEIANAIGYWNQYQMGLDANDTRMLRYWGLVTEAPLSYMPEGMAELLLLYGPLWVGSAEPGPHIRVITGMAGDGTYNGTTVYINDPWERGMEYFDPSNSGSRYTETFQQFMQKQEDLGFSELEIQNPIYVAHLPIFTPGKIGK
jgi:hypothetical protein